MNKLKELKMITSHNFYSRCAVIVVIIVTVSVLFGWVFEIEKLPQLYLGLAAMNPMTAIGLFACAVSVWLLGQTSTQARRIAAVLGALAFTLGFIRWAELFLGFQFDIDLLFFQNSIESAAFPARMAAATAMMFVILGSSLFILNVSERMALQRIAQILAMVCGFIAFFSLGLFILRAISLLELPFFFNLAPHTATCFILLSIGILMTFFRPGDIFKNLSIANKFTLSFGIIFVLLATIIFIALSSYNTLEKIAKKEADVRQRVDTSLLLEGNLLRTNLLLNKYTDVYSQPLLKDLEKYRSLSIQYRTELRGLNPAPAVIAALDSFEVLLMNRIALADEIISAVNREAPPAEIASLRQEREVTDDEATSYVKYIVEIEEEELAKTTNSGSELRKNLARNTIVVILFILIPIGLVLYSIWRSVGKPLLVLKEAALRIAALNFTTAFDTTTFGKDEIGQLARAFDEMTGRLKESYSNLSQAKAKNETMLSSIGDGVFAIDNNENIILFNNAASQISGYSVEESIGKPYTESLRFIFEKGGLVNNEFIKKALSGHKAEMINHTLIVRKDGQKTPVADSAAPILNSQGKVEGVVVVFRDVAKEREVDRMKDEFVSVASHELRTPLTAIDGLISMVLDGEYGEVNKELKQPLSDVNISSERLIHLVNDLLNLSRIQAGKLKYTLSEFDIKPVIAEVVELLQPIAEPKGLSLSSSNINSLNVSADGDKVKQILNNIIGNSLKFTDKGSIIVSTKPGKDKIVVFITDTGVGISKEDQTKLFGKFQQLESNQRRPAGTGLGLHISKEMACKMGGDLWIEKSESGKGSSFAFSIPIAKSSSAEKVKKEIEAEAKENPEQKSDIITKT